MTVEQFLTAVGGAGLGGVLVALINKLVRPPEDRQAVHAASDRARAEGAAAVMTAVGDTFIDVTGGLRAEIARMQDAAGELRERAVQLEAELNAAMQRVEDLERQLAESKAHAARLQADLDRVRNERDTALEREQLLADKLELANGEVRQLQQVLASASAARSEERA